MSPTRVLTVDDDWAITKLIRVNLEDDETQVREVSTGLDCIRVLNEEGADVVLLDLRLPDFSGWGILGLLRLSDSFKNIPVIVVSVEPPDLERMRQFHPDDYIQKPFDIRDLMARVKRVVSQKQGPN